MTDDELKTEIGKEIGTNCHQFREKSKLMPVSKVSDVSITGIEKINSDNPKLDNYKFRGNARIGISQDGNGDVSEYYIIEGTAKVDTAIQINEPMSINKQSAL